MAFGQQNPFSGTVTVFHDRRLPEAAIPVGYATLVEAYGLAIPAPFTLSAIGPRHKVYEVDGWRVYPIVEHALVRGGVEDHSPTPSAHDRQRKADAHEDLPDIERPGAIEAGDLDAFRCTGHLAPA